MLYGCRIQKQLTLLLKRSFSKSFPVFTLKYLITITNCYIDRNGIFELMKQHPGEEISKCKSLTKNSRFLFKNSKYMRRLHSLKLSSAFGNANLFVDFRAEYCRLAKVYFDSLVQLNKFKYRETFFLNYLYFSFFLE